MRATCPPAPLIFTSIDSLSRYGTNLPTAPSPSDMISDTIKFLDRKVAMIVSKHFLIDSAHLDGLPTSVFSSITPRVRSSG